MLTCTKRIQRSYVILLLPFGPNSIPFGLRAVNVSLTNKLFRTYSGLSAVLIDSRFPVFMN